MNILRTIYFTMSVLLFSLPIFADSRCGIKFEQCKELAGKSIVFAVHKQYPKDHHNTATIFQCGEINQWQWKQCAGNSQLIRADFDADGNIAKVAILLETPSGIIRDPDVSFDASRVIFSMRKSMEDSYNIYELNLADSSVKQLTRLAEVCDIDPAYMPDGSIVFASTRAAKYCGCNRHIMCNLYKMGADGANIVQIGNSIEFEHTPAVMSDGRILYTRWEYVDRNFSGAQGLWTCNPDGTRHALYWGQETPQPCLNAVQLPNSTRVAAILGSCHDVPWGALAVIDRKINIEGAESVVKVYPKSARKLIGGHSDSMLSIPLKYEDPYPISETLLLVSRMAQEKSSKMDLYAVDISADTERLVATAENPELGIFDAREISARIAPQSIADQRIAPNGKSLVYVSDVYVGTHMKGIKRGDIKYLRVIENPPKINYSHGWWENQGSQAPAMNFDDYDHKVPLGIVPVNDDGSAYFEVPSGKFIYLQALDANGDMVQTMRSGFVVLSGEINSCTGCHESRFSPPPVDSKASKHLRGSPAQITKYPENVCGKYFSYMDMVQPIFDTHCVECHDIDGGGAAKVILAGDEGLVFNKSYLELHSKKYISAIGAGGDKVQEANTWGAKQSIIVNMIRQGHGDTAMSEREFATLRLWIDLNAPYYDTDDFIYGDNPAGRSPLTFKEILRVKELCKAKGILNEKNSGQILARNYPFELFSFSRPETSEILAGAAKGSQEYKEALAIIELGAARLKANPRADMAGFKTSRQMEKFRDRFARLEKLNSAACAAESNGERLPDAKSLKEVSDK